MMRMIRPAPVRKEIVVAATAKKAFQVFTAGQGRWWPHTHTVADVALDKAVLEPEPNGRWYGLGVDGSISLWGEVLVWDPPQRLLLAWRLGADFKYDPELLTEVEVRFSELEGGRTRVELEHRGLERMGEGVERARAAFESPNGWGGLLSLFKAAAET